MRPSTLREAMDEAKRFIKAAKFALDQKESDNYPGDYFWASKQSGSARRASMDLTRKLADLRAGR